MSTSLNTSIEPQFRTIDGLKIRFAESEQGDEHALLLSPWPESRFVESMRYVRAYPKWAGGHAEA